MNIAEINPDQLAVTRYINRTSSSRRLCQGYNGKSFLKCKVLCDNELLDLDLRAELLRNQKILRSLKSYFETCNALVTGQAARRVYCVKNRQLLKLVKWALDFFLKGYAPSVNKGLQQIAAKNADCQLSQLILSEAARQQQAEHVNADLMFA